MSRNTVVADVIRVVCFGFLLGTAARAIYEAEEARLGNVAIVLVIIAIVGLLKRLMEQDGGK